MPQSPIKQQSRVKSENVVDDAFHVASMLSHLPTYEMIRVGRIIDRGVARIAQKVGVGAPELRVLFLISRLKACTLTEAIQHTTINHGNTSRVAAKLLKEGYLERIPDDEDLRKKKLKVTDKGAEIVCRAAPYREILDQMILAGFSESERDALSEMLKQISSTVYRHGFMDELELAFEELDV